MIPDIIKNGVRNILDPITNVFIKMKITPNIITSFGMVLSLFSGMFYALGHFILGSIILIFAGISDTFDGQIARKTGSESKFGAFYDSTTDRFNEFFVLAGIGYFYYKSGAELYMYASVLAIFFSIMISYTRARAEGLGIKIRRGVFTRVERVLYIIIISYLPLKFFNYMLLLFVILTFITIIERMIIVNNKVKEVD